MKGYAGTILRINLTNKEIKKEKLEEKFAKKYLGQDFPLFQRLQLTLKPHLQVPMADPWWELIWVKPSKKQAMICSS